MKHTSDSSRFLAAVLVIGLILVAFTVVCADGVHIPALREVAARCVVMSHSAAVSAAVDSETGSTLIAWQALAVAVAMFILVVPVAALPRFAPSHDGLQAPDDPLHGRLRI